CHSVPDTAIVDVYPTNKPTVIISANPGYIVGIYTPVTLTANVTDSSINMLYQWRKNGRDIFGETNKSVSLVFGVDIKEGDFISVWISSTPSCSGTDTILSEQVAVTHKVSVEDIESSKIALYPNPVQNILTVQGV